MIKRQSNFWKLNQLLFPYRYDAIALLLLFLVLLGIYSPILSEGHIIFSDLDFPGDSKRYLEELTGIWNERWNTSTQLNLPRLLYTFWPWLLSAVFGFSGAVFIKTYIILLVIISAFSMYLFGKRITSVYLGSRFSFASVFFVSLGALFYAANPWFITRIQHLYLLCGYSLLPLALLLFFNIFDPKFQSQLIKNYRVSRQRMYSRNLFDIFLAALVISTLSAAIHYFFYTIIMYAGLWAALLVKTLAAHRREGVLYERSIIANFFVKAIVLVFFLSLLSFHWLSVYVMGILKGTQGSQHNINVNDTLMMFSRNANAANSLALTGYWWPMFDLSALPLSFNISVIFIIILIITGFLSSAGRYPILLFFTVLTVLFLILSTGTYYKYIDSLFVTLVTKTPVIGSMFRDPNKLSGLTALGYSLFIIFGFHWLNRTFLTHGRISIAIGIYLAAVFLYLAPYYDRYLSGYYKPVIVPEEYSLVNRYLASNGSSRVLIFPVADNMTQPSTGVATYFWNTAGRPDILEKATGDYTIYQMERDTFFHHEGNLPSIGYHLSYLQHDLDLGLSNSNAGFLPVLGIDTLVYQNQFTGQEDRQQFNLQMLDMQRNAAKIYENSIFTVYRFTGSDTLKRVDTPVINTEGIASESLLARLGITGEASSVFYTTLSTHEESLNLKASEAYLFTKQPEQVWLNTLPADQYLYPALELKTGNPLLGWSQTAAHTGDWLWQLESLGIYDFGYEFDFSSNLAMTYSPASLVPPNYRWPALNGAIVLDFNTMLRMDLFFKADNPESFEIAANPISEGNVFPLIRGIIAQSDQGKLWQVAKSGMIQMHEKTPYRFSVLVSGRGANQLHLKLRFYDKNQNELGISYAVAPGEFTNYDSLEFYTEFVTPPETAECRIDILSRQRAEQRIHWWIHDLELEDLSDFSIPNSFSVPFNKDSGRYRFFMRNFHSPSGGTLLFDTAEKQTEIKTQSISKSGFVWTELGTFNLVKGEKFTITNHEGFQGINLIAAVPENETGRFMAAADAALHRSTTVIGYEAESDFDFNGEIQSSRRAPVLSRGNAIRSRSGEATRRVIIPESSIYHIELFGGYKYTAPGMTLSVIPLDLTSDYFQPVSFPVTFSNDEDSDGIIIENTDEDPRAEYKRKIIDLPDEFPSLGKFKTGDLRLPAGTYNIKIEFSSDAENLLSVNSLRKFSPAEIKLPAYLPPQQEIDCSECEKISYDDLSLNVRRSGGNQIDFSAEAEATCSCDWYIVSSSLLRVSPGKEYYLGYTAGSEHLDKRHSKILYLNEEKRIISTDYIPEVEESYKSRDNKYEHLTIAPEKAVYAVIQWWARGSKFDRGLLNVQDLGFYAVSEFALLDALAVVEAKTPSTPVSGKSVINSFKSPSPLWVRGNADPVIINGLTQGHVIGDQDEIPDLGVMFKAMYFRGLAGIPAALIFLFIGFRILKHPLPLIRRIKHLISSGIKKRPS